jgi:hypothetical protein
MAARERGGKRHHQGLTARREPAASPAATLSPTQHSMLAGRQVRCQVTCGSYPFGVQVATIRGCLKAEDKACTSAAFAASQAPALLYSTAVTATDPPENTKSVKMKVMWPFPSQVTSS